MRIIPLCSRRYTVDHYSPLHNHVLFLLELTGEGNNALKTTNNALRFSLNRNNPILLQLKHLSSFLTNCDKDACDTRISLHAKEMLPQLKTLANLISKSQHQPIFSNNDLIYVFKALSNPKNYKKLQCPSSDLRGLHQYFTDNSQTKEPDEIISTTLNFLFKLINQKKNLIEMTFAKENWQ